MMRKVIKNLRLFEMETSKGETLFFLGALVGVTEVQIFFVAIFHVVAEVDFVCFRGDLWSVDGKIINHALVALRQIGFFQHFETVFDILKTQKKSKR